MFQYYRRILDVSVLRQKRVFLFGFSALSLSVIDYLSDGGVRVSGLCDGSIRQEGELLGGVPLLPPASVWSRLGNDCAVICGYTNHRHVPELKREVLRAAPECLFLVLESISEVYIDVSGNCNLRCRSCQVCNHAPDSFDYRGRTEMPMELFEKILQKVKTELPENPAIFLFDYGEPLLASRLPEYVHRVHEQDMLAVISSNLSLHYDFLPLLLEQPDILKISVSGFHQEVYGTTHNGGDIELVKRNMRTIRALLDQYRLDRVLVMVGYHLYSNNAGADYEQMKTLCRELGFLFQPRRASFCNILKQSGIDPYTPADRQFIRTYYENSADILSTAPLPTPQTGTCNIAENKLFIDYNGTTMLCYLVMHKAAVYRPYLEVPLQEIHQWQKEHWICTHCKQVGLASLC